MLPTSRGFFGREISDARTFSDGPGRRRAPLLVIIRVRLFTRGACAAARCCAIMPPIEAPQTWARAMPSASRTPTLSAAMSASEYGLVTFMPIV